MVYRPLYIIGRMSDNVWILILLFSIYLLSKSWINKNIYKMETYITKPFSIPSNRSEMAVYLYNSYKDFILILYI